MCSRLVVTTAHHCSTFLKLRLENLIDIILDIIGQPALSASRRCGSWFLMCSLGVAPVLMQTGALGASMLTLAHPDGLFFLGWLVPALSSSNQRLCSKKSPPNEPKPNQTGVRSQSPFPSRTITGEPPSSAHLAVHSLTSPCAWDLERDSIALPPLLLFILLLLPPSPSR
jgi:hypothetical protein